MNHSHTWPIRKIIYGTPSPSPGLDHIQRHKDMLITLSLTHTHTHTLSLPPSLSLTHTHTDTHTLTQTQTFTHTQHSFQSLTQPYPSLLLLWAFGGNDGVVGDGRDEVVWQSQPHRGPHQLPHWYQAHGMGRSPPSYPWHPFAHRVKHSRLLTGYVALKTWVFLISFIWTLADHLIFRWSP